MGRPTLAVKVLALTCFSLIALISSGSAKSQENSFVTLEQALINGGESSYFAVRCAALYASMASWAGEERLGTETYSKLFDNAESLLYLAAMMRNETNGTPFDSAIQIADEDFGRISKIYIARYKNNYANTGQAWESDDLWKSDLSFCSEMGRQK